MNRKLFLIFIISFVCVKIVQSQKVIVTDDATYASGNGAASAVLDVYSTGLGFLAPRMTLFQRGNIPTPATGLLIYQTDNNPGFYFYDGSQWLQLTSNASTYWSKSGNNIYNNNSGNVGIGNSSPSSMLSVGTSSQFQVNSTGDLAKINNVSYSWPSSQGASSTFLKDDGSGTLSWATALTSQTPQNLTWNTSSHQYDISTGTTQPIPLFATSSTNAGLVTGSNNAGTSYYLRADGTWAIPPNPGGTVTSVSGVSPISSSGGTTPSISIANAAADGTTKGAAAFTAADFNDASGVISIDYTNGQAASSSTKGFLTSADWTTFNNKGNGSVTSVAAGNGMSFTTITSSGSVTMGTPSTIDSTTTNSVSAGTHTHALGVIGITKGGTGATSRTAAFNNLAPSQTSNSGKYLTTDGTNTSWASGGLIPSLTSGSVIFSGGGTTLSQDNSNFFYDNTNDRLAIGSNTFDATNPEKLKVDAGVTTSKNVISGYGSIDSYLQLNIKNNSTGVNSSADIVATANNGDENSGYIDMGTNGQNYSQSAFNIGGANDSYIYSMGVGAAGGNLSIGTGSSGTALKFHTGGTTSSNERMRIDGTGNVGIGATSPGNKLEINQGTAGNSGLRFTQLTSGSSTSSSNGKVLSVNSSGDVIMTTATATGVPLSGITAATATNTIDNLNFTQTWNWSTAATESPLAFSANALTSGNLFSLSTTSTSHTGNLFQVTDASTSASTNGFARLNFSGAHTGNGLQIDDVTATGTVVQINPSALTSGTGFQINSTNTSQSGSSFYVNSNTNTITSNGLVRFNFTGNHSTGTGVQVSDLTSQGTVMQITPSMITSGTGLSINSTATANSFTGSLANITLSGNDVSNTGSLLSLNSSGTSSLVKAIKATIASTGALGTGTGTGGGINFYFSGAHTGNGFQVDDITTTGTIMQINPAALTTGVGLQVNSTNSAQTGNSFLVNSNSTGAIVSGLARFQFTGAHTGNGLQIDDVATTGTVMQINPTALSTGVGLQVNSTNAAQTGSSLYVNSNSTGVSANGLVRFNFTGAHTGNGFQLNDVATTGTVMQINPSALTSGVGLQVNSTNAAQTGSSLYVNSNSTGAAANGLVRFNFTGAHTNYGFQLSDVTTTGTVMQLNPSALTTGTGLQINSTNASQTGSSLLVNSSSTGAIVNGLARFNFTGAHTNNGLQVDDVTTTGTAVQFNTSALTTGTGFQVNSTNASQTGSSLLVNSSSTGAIVNGLARFNFTGAHTGNGVQLDDVTTSGTAAAINASGIYTGTGLVKLTANAATTGTIGAIYGDGITTGTLLDITSAYPSGNSTNGLLRVANTGAITNGLIFRAQSNNTAGSGLTVKADGTVGIGTTTPNSTLEISGATTLDKISSTPTCAQGQTVVYTKGNYYVILYNDAGTYKYRYMDLTSTNANWTYSTTAP